MAASDHLHPQQVPGQGELFSGAAYERPKDPSAMAPDEWATHHGENIAYHGTFNPSWRHSPIVHAGTIGQASYRLDAVSRSIKDSPSTGRRTTPPRLPERTSDWDEDPEPQTHTGRVHAVRMTARPYKTVLSDPEVNTAHYLHLRERGHEDWEIPPSVTDSMD